MTDLNTYILAFDVEDPRTDVSAINRHITSSEAIEGWWNYLPLVYVVQSRAAPKDLSRSLHEVAAGAPFFLAAIDTASMDGWLPRQAWDWFAERDPRHGGVPRRVRDRTAAAAGE